MKKVLWLAMGGTVAMTRNSKTGALVPTHSVDKLYEVLPEIKQIADIEFCDIENIDSTNVKPAHWVKLLEKIEENYEKFDGFVVTHGTDTMTFSASGLSFMTRDLGKPIIFTGAQLPLADAITDAHQNLLHSFKFATEDVGEVAICFGNKLIRGNRAQKRSEFSWEAFESVNVPPIGEYGLSPKLFAHRIRRDHTRKTTFVSDFENKIHILHLYPGIQSAIFDMLVDTGIKGIVINAFGAGNIPGDLIPAIQNAIKKGVSIVVTTQCDLGAAEMFLYEVGLEAQKNASVSGLDMTLEAAYAKLQVVLAKTDDPKKIKKLMQSDFAGELTEDIF
ncbi:MAG: asparaginase [Candidatus Peregrinibacteria bacterium]|nr:asparaginase [Candidatus Peregrinibacteria bacterium]